MKETWYVWKKLVSIGGEPPRLITPHGDPMEHEFPFDGLYTTVDEAIRDKNEQFPDEEMFLCRMTLDPIAKHKNEDQKTSAIG